MRSMSLADGMQGAAAGERLRAAAAALARLQEPGLVRQLGVCAEASALIAMLPPVRCGPCTRLSRWDSCLFCKGHARVCT